MKRALAAGFLPLLALAQGEALFDGTPSEDSSAPAAAASAPFSEWDGITQLFPRPVVTPVSHAKSAEPTLPSLSLVGEFPLPDSAPEGLSGIAWRGGIPGFGDSWDDLYALVEDSGGRLHSATIGIDRGTGAITNAVVSPAGSIPGAADLEGVCCGAVPVAGGTVPTLFASDERGPAIWAKAAFDASSPEWASLPLPESLRRCRFNRALESLALSPDGRLLWTANEGPLPEDGPEPTAERGAKIRIYALPVSGLLPKTNDSRPAPASSTQAPSASPTEPAFRFYELNAAAGGKMPHLPDPFNGLAELCALPDGRLLALERAYGLRTRGPDDPRASLIAISIYLVDPLGSAPAGPSHAESAESKPHAESAEFAELESHAESAESVEPGGASSPSEPGSPVGGAAERSEAEGVIQHSAFSIQHSPSSPLPKTLLWRGLTGRANYEGMTLGPELADGSRALILVSDGDVTRKGAFAFPWSKRLLSFRLRLP